MQLLQMAVGSWVTQTIYVTAKLRIADLLSEGPKSCDEIAAATQTPAHSLLRLLRAIRSLGIVETVESGKFALTAVGRSLQAERPGSVRAMVLTLGEIHYDAWRSLLHSVKTGTPAFPRVFGARLFDHLDRSLQAGETFHEAMTDLSALISQAVLVAYDFSGIEVLVDVGGGYGQFLTAVLQMYPNMRGFLLDTPAVLAAANEQLAFHTCRERCTLVPGNFLEAVPRGAGAYLMSGVIHDWDDEDAVKILENCRRAMTPNGKVLVVETVLPAGETSCFGALLDLNMMVMTGGRERTERDFRRLFDAAGFTVTQIIPTLAPQCVIEGTRNISASIVEEAKC
jgi:ubiquinone/menaquinone biosynthesis C-methylase UbiE